MLSIYIDMSFLGLMSRLSHKESKQCRVNEKYLVKSTEQKSCLNRNLTLILLEPKLISLCPGQPAHPCSLTRLYTFGWPTSSSHFEIPKMIMDSYKNGRWISPLKKFSRLRVKIKLRILLTLIGFIYLFDKLSLGKGNGILQYLGEYFFSIWLWECFSWEIIWQKPPAVFIGPRIFYWLTIKFLNTGEWNNDNR